MEPGAESLHAPATLPDVEAAVSRLDTALDRRETVAIYSDRDVDGITGAAILTTLLETLDATPVTHIPGKYDGYGLHEDAVRTLLDQGVDVLTVVDCGTTAHDEIATATEAGVEVVVIDHHDPERALPDATAVINPRRSDSTYPNPNLAAGALAWKVGQALVETRAPPHLDEYHRHTLPLAAVATVGDYMHLTRENRAIVREGFTRLDTCDLPGLVQTADHAGVESMRDLRWSLVPLLNAAQEAEDGERMLDVLLADDPARIDAHLDDLDAYRDQRRHQRQQRLAHLETMVETQLDPETAAVIFVETEEYVGGGPMNEISQRWYRPVITYRATGDGYKGGGRTAPDVDLLELYDACSEHLDDYWGHPGAAGFTVSRSNLPAFERQFKHVLRDRYDPESFRPTIEVDAVVDPLDLDVDTVEDLQRFGPYGTGHDEPIVLLEAVQIVDSERFGDDDTHWKGWIDATDDVTLIDWHTDTINDDPPPNRCDVAGTGTVDTYDDTVSVSIEAIR